MDIIIRTKRITRRSPYFDDEISFEKILTKLRGMKTQSRLEKRLLEDMITHVLRIHSSHRPPQYISNKLKDIVFDNQIIFHSHGTRNRIKDVDNSITTRWEHCNPVANLVKRVLDTKNSIKSILNDNIIAIITVEEDLKLGVKEIKEKRNYTPWEEIYKEVGIDYSKYVIVEEE